MTCACDSGQPAKLEVRIEWRRTCCGHGFDASPSSSCAFHMLRNYGGNAELREKVGARVARRSSMDEVKPIGPVRCARGSLYFLCRNLGCKSQSRRWPLLMKIRAIRSLTCVRVCGNTDHARLLADIAPARTLPDLNPLVPDRSITRRHPPTAKYSTRQGPVHVVRHTGARPLNGEVARLRLVEAIGRQSPEHLADK